MSQQSFHGIIAAVLTPLKDNLRPDFPAFISYCQQLLENGCHGLVILGSTGEANSIHLSDRLALIKEAAKYLPPEKLLIGTGSCAVEEAAQLSQCAANKGVKNLLILPPFYYAPVTDAGVQAYYDRLIETVADPDLRIFLYNFPKLTGYRFSPSLIKDLIARHGPVIAGLKDSSGDFKGMKEYARIDPDFSVFAGTERYLLDILTAGGAGCISATINITAPQARAVWDGRTQDLQDEVTALRAAIETYPLVPALKAMVEHRGGGRNWHNMLPPFVPLDKDVKRRLFSEFEDARK